jgi:hypothetical protein
MERLNLPRCKSLVYVFVIVVQFEPNRLVLEKISVFSLPSKKSTKPLDFGRRTLRRGPYDGR